ncbi:hypothetical protein ACIO1C_25260 [Streptomyces sp. NPDC087420]|uniref:hypothetical protein n=1 Tax=Streptomyces sp. NPDC087420 TaxID=3365785 RepID=UPI0038363E48
MIQEKLDALSQLMAEHVAMPFPAGLRGLDVEGQDMVMLDADAYGYASRVVKGPLGEPSRGNLRRLVGVFERVLPAISDEYAATYYRHVREVAVLAGEIESMRHE